uniref:Uncharacterized protein n=1 Tax=Physcomitrium patens TaxID=3218 RepID=A0A2K1IP63_PHYPA|nr:hypothetical protein PHYPA_027389 [Physcomitrium patens]
MNSFVNCYLCILAILPISYSEFFVHIGSVASTLPAALAPVLGPLGTTVPPAVTPLPKPFFFFQNPSVLADASPGLGAAAAALSSPALVVPFSAAAADAMSQASEYLLVNNMFDLNCSDSAFDMDIKQGMQECSKFVVVKHIFD